MRLRLPKRRPERPAGGISEAPPAVRRGAADGEPTAAKACAVQADRIPTAATRSRPQTARSAPASRSSRRRVHNKSLPGGARMAAPDGDDNGEAFGSTRSDPTRTQSAPDEAPGCSRIGVFLPGRTDGGADLSLDRPKTRREWRRQEAWDVISKTRARSSAEAVLHRAKHAMARCGRLRWSTPSTGAPDARAGDRDPPSSRARQGMWQCVPWQAGQAPAAPDLCHDPGPSELRVVSVCTGR